MGTQALQRREPAQLPTKIETPEDLALVLSSDRAQAMIAPFLGDDVSPAVVVAGMLIAVEKEPKLLKCTPSSLVLAVAESQRAGLDIGTTAHIVPFNTNVGTREQPRWESRATFIADYKGLARLMIVCGAVRGVEMRCVYEKDHFEFVQGLVPVLEHRPVDRHCDRGALKGAYVILRFPFGRSQFEYMTVEAIDEIRQKYSKQWKVGAVPAWYAMKTVVRQASKLIPQESRFAALFRAVQADIEEEFGKGIPAGVDGIVADEVETPTSGPTDEPPPRVYTAPVQTPKAAAAPAAAPSIAGSGDDAATAAAKAFKFPFQKDKPNSLYGKPLGEIKDEALQKVAAWIRDIQHEPGKEKFHADTLQAIGLVLGAREKEQLKMELETAAAPAAAAGVGAAGSVGAALAPDFPGALLDDEDDLPF